MAELNKGGFLSYPSDYKQLIFYRKTVVLYDMTFFFKEKFLLKGDRTQDQMEQAARSGKQNIVEGLTDGMTSREMEIKLLNVARGSIKELLEDYQDYLRVHNLMLWDEKHERYNKMLKFCFENSEVAIFSTYFDRWSDEELCNIAITLCHQVDRGLMKFIANSEARFLAEGGIKEKMSDARRRHRGY